MTTDGFTNPIEGLGQDDRVLIQARMLPMNQLSEQQVEAVRCDYKRYTDKNAIFDAQVAKEIGLATATLSQFRNSSYKGNCEKIARVLNDWMERHARKRRAELPADYVTTRVAEEIKKIVDVACTTCSMAAIVAPSGCGKSMVLKVLAEKYRGRYIYCTEHMSSGPFVRKIAAESDVTVAGRRRARAELLDAIIEKLAGTNRPLFLDEAHQLPRDAFPTIRAIHDQAQVPIIMAGADEILQSINDRTQGHGQFASRCYAYNLMEHVANVEDDPGTHATLGRPMFSHEEVHQFLHNLNVKLEDGGFQMLWAVACLPNHGSLRTVRRVVHLLRADTARSQQPITRKEVIWALGLLFGQVGNHIGRMADHHIQKVKAA